MEPRELTREEARQLLIDHVKAMAHYWATLPDKSTRARCEGVAFSILSMLDGCAGSMPAFVVAPAPHPSDRADCEANEENWWPEAPEVACDLSGDLHDLFLAEEAKQNAVTREQWKPVVARCIADLARQNNLTEDVVRSWGVDSYGHSTAKDGLTWCVMIMKAPGDLKHVGWPSINKPGDHAGPLLLVPYEPKVR